MSTHSVESKRAIELQHAASDATGWRATRAMPIRRSPARPPSPGCSEAAYAYADAARAREAAIGI